MIDEAGHSIYRSPDSASLLPGYPANKPGRVARTKRSGVRGQRRQVAAWLALDGIRRSRHFARHRVVGRGPNNVGPFDRRVEIRATNGVQRNVKRLGCQPRRDLRVTATVKPRPATAPSLRAQEPGQAIGPHSGKKARSGACSASCGSRSRPAHQWRAPKKPAPKQAIKSLLIDARPDHATSKLSRHCSRSP